MQRCFKMSFPETLRNVFRDKRGVMALTFLAFSTAFLGIAGFGIEGGTFYLERRHGQNAADAAAIAGVLALVKNGNSFGGAQQAGVNVATDNGYTNGARNATVAVTPGTYSGGTFTPSGGVCTQATCNAVRANIARNQTRYLSALFMGRGTTNVAETAVAAIAVTGPACSLSLAGGLAFSGNAKVAGVNCTLASNRTDADSIDFGGAGAQKQQANAILVGAGGCSQNGTQSNTSCTQSGTLLYQPPTLDPYQALQTDPNAIPATVNSTNCGSSATVSSPYVINATNKVYCIGSDLTGGALNSGTYFLYNASINITSGTLTCSGCTFILTGSAANKLGQIKINGGTVTMSAPSSTQQPPPYDSNYIGMLFYMDPRFPKQAAQKCGVGNAQVNISGSSTTTLNGGMYFPNASVCVSGNAFSSTESCLSLVAWSIYYDGSANETLTGCSSFDTKTAEVRAIQLVL